MNFIFEFRQFIFGSNVFRLRLSSWFSGNVDGFAPLSKESLGKNGNGLHLARSWAPLKRDSGLRDGNIHRFEVRNDQLPTQLPAFFRFANRTVNWIAIVVTQSPPLGRSFRVWHSTECHRYSFRWLLCLLTGWVEASRGDSKRLEEAAKTTDERKSGQKFKYKSNRHNNVIWTIR